MIQVGSTLVSREIIDEAFVCDISACKGACCVEGESGAPVEQAETDILKSEWENFKPYISKEGVEVVESQGTYVEDFDGEWVTPLMKDETCAYAVKDDSGALQCGIELAWKDGKTSFRKPVSCQLYPVRVTSYAEFDAVNYHRWNICSPARACGAKLNVPLFHFLKDALIRKYGEDWYAELEEVAVALKSNSEES